MCLVSYIKVDYVVYYCVHVHAIKSSNLIDIHGDSPLNPILLPQNSPQVRKQSVILEMPISYKFA